MKIGSAIEQMKNGHFVYRHGWKQKGLRLRYVPGRKTQIIDIAPSIVVVSTLNGNDEADYMPSQSDLLANDWEIDE